LPPPLNHQVSSADNKLEECMLIKRFFLPLLLSFFVIRPLSAATVSFLVIETGLPSESGINQYSDLWESGLLDVFFESGHIVSNAPVLRLDYAPGEAFPAEAREALGEALDGGAEFFIIALLEYQQGSTGGFRPGNVSLRVFRARNCELICEMKHTDTIVKPIKEEFDSLKNAARGLISRLK
jgi:hypothetical protein